MGAASCGARFSSARVASAASSNTGRKSACCGSRISNCTRVHANYKFADAGDEVVAREGTLVIEHEWMDRNDLACKQVGVEIYEPGISGTGL